MPVKNQRYIPIANALIATINGLHDHGFKKEIVISVILEAFCRELVRYGDFSPEFLKNYIGLHVK